MPPPGSIRSPREHAFAHELELARREAGLTVAQLAQALHCVSRTLRRYLNAERRPPRQVVVMWERTCLVRSGRLTDLYDRLDVPDGEAARSIDGPAGARARPRNGRFLFNLPAVVASFTGREELVARLDASLGRADTVIAQAIIGPAGVGKTQLAARYVQQRAARYDLVAWIRAEDGGIADLAALASRMGVRVDSMSPSDHARAALERLASSDGRWSWLLVVDNVQSPSDLGRLLPRTGVGHVLVTSRDRALRQLAPVLTVDVFDEDTAARFLTGRAGRPGDAAGARSLARALGCLPLALSHAAAYCESGTSFASYLGLLEHLPARELFDSNPEVSYSLTVASTWRTSMTAATSQAALAADVLAMAAYVGPDAIPRTLFTGLVDSGTAAGQKGLSDAFNAIARFSLATMDDETLSVHRLLQKTIREETGLDPALRVLRALRDAFPDDARTPASWVQAEQLLPHCLALAGQIANTGSASGELVELLNRVSWYLNNAEPGSRRSLAIARQNVSAAERVLDSDCPERLMALNHLATALQWAGRLDEAVTYFESVLAERTRVLGVEHEHTLISSSNLALAYKDAGLSTKAIEIYERLLPAQERILGPDDRQCSFSRLNLAVSYKAAGRVSDSIALLEPLLAAWEVTLGSENPETLKTRHHVAAAYRAAGDPERAIKILEPLLRVRKQIVGAKHPHTLMTGHELGRAYGDAGRADAALALLRELVPACEARLGARHPDTLAARHSLGLAHAQVGQLDPAMAVLGAVLADREQELGRAHRDTHVTRDALAHLYRHPAPSEQSAL